MKTKGLVFITWLVAGALIASPALAKPEKKSAGASTSKQKRTSLQTAQVMPGHRYQQNRQKVSSRIGNTRNYAGTRYTGSRNHVVPQYRGTTYGSNGYYGGTRTYYGNNVYYGGTGYYGGGSGYPYYSSYSSWPYSNWSYGTYGGYYPYSYSGGYPYTSYNSYSYYTPTYGYNPSLVAAVQRRLGQFGYYHGVVDGVIGPRTRGAIVAFESRNGLVADGQINRPLLDTLGLG